MTRKTKIILLSILVTLSLAISGAFIAADSLIKTEEIKKIIVSSIEENLVGTKTSIGSLSYSLGARVDFNIKNLRVSEKKSKKDVLKTDEINLKVSILAILMGGGEIDIKINSPYVNIFKKNKILNWNTYLKKAKSSQVTTQNNNEKSKPIEVPSFIENSKVNFRISQLKIDYMDEKLSSFVFDKILLKNLSLNKMTAYEVVSKINYQLGNNETIKFNAGLVGELSLKNLISSNRFSAKSFLNITDISLMNYNFPSINSEINLNIEQDSTLGLNVLVKSEDLINSSLKALIKKESLNLNVSSFSLNLNELLKILNQKIENLDMNNSKLKVLGDFSFDTKKSKLENKININLSDSLIYKVEGQAIKLGLSSNLKNQNLNLKSSITAYEGNASLEVESKIDLLNPPSSIDQLAPITINLEGENFNLPFALEKDKLVPNSGKKSMKSSKKKFDFPSLPIVKSYINLKNIMIAGMKTKVLSTIKAHKKNISSSNTLVYIDQSKNKSSFNINLENTISSKFKLDSKNLNVKSFKSFLPLKMKDLDMPMDLNTSGSFEMDKKLKYNVFATLSSKNGSLKGLKLKEVIKSFLGKLGKYLPKKKDTKITENYDSLYAKAKATEELIDIKSFNLVGKNKSLELNLKGKVSQVNTKSELTGDIYLRDYVEKLKKNFGTTKIPLRLKGNGFSILPEFSYTSKRLVKKASKTKVKKLKNKLKEDIKKKAKDLFKGFKL